MSSVVNNPEALEGFARNLKKFNGELREKVSSLQGQFSQLGEVWRDQEHQKFAQEFEQTMRTLNKFIQDADAHAPFLMRKAQKLREYLNQR
jgi:WXG100 family type VII secretion target